MTNAELNLQVAVKALNEGKLTGKSKEFIDQIKNYTKRELRALSKKQYQWLNDIYQQYA